MVEAKEKEDEKSLQTDLSSVTDSVKIKAEKDIAIDFMESVLLAFILTIGFVVIMCSEYNAPTCIIYIAPCFVTSLSRIVRNEFAYKIIFSAHIIMCVYSSFMICALVGLTILNKEYQFLQMLLCFYPVYELITAIVCWKISKEVKGESAC